MPKLSKTKARLLKGLLNATGSGEEMADAVIQVAQAETEQEGEAALNEMHRLAFEECERQHKQGVVFGKADLQEMLGQDEIPAKCKKFLKRDKAAPLPEPKDPGIFFEPPVGWSTEPVSGALHIRKGRKLMGEISIIDDFSYRHMLQSNESRERQQIQTKIPLDGVWTKLPVQFGDCHGFKFSYYQKSFFWKRTEYLLEVPGGKAHVFLDACGKDFDEEPIEGRLKTLRIIQVTRRISQS